MINLIHLSTVRDFCGVFEVTVLVNNNKEYTFCLGSQYDVEEFQRLTLHHPGKALNYLKKVRIKDVK